jgi:glutamate synthase (NADPH) small chain
MRGENRFSLPKNKLSMGKPTGFKEYKREYPATEAPEQRKQHFKEFLAPLKEEKSHQQAARCMDCGVPFCHQGCPLGNNIPEFNDAVYEGDWQQAFVLLDATNNFPEFTGRICPAPCERSCVLGINQPPVTIELIEKTIAERAYAEGWVQPQPPVQRSGKRVAVIGSGPAGMAAAAQLNRAGHLVTVFERDEKPGGLLRYGIPDFKLEKWVVERRVEILEAEGIEFRCGVTVGEDVRVDQLQADYEAVVLCNGATVPRDMPLEGRAFQGVHFAMDYLTQNNRKVAGDWQQPVGDIDAKDKDVIVIGGGDTGSDCIGTANRQGARSILQMTWGNLPPAERLPENPWPEWPMILETTSSHEEGCEREFGVLTKAFKGDENGQLRALEVVNIRWNPGRKGYVELEETRRELPCQLALISIGFAHPQAEGLLQDLGLELDRRGNVRAPHYRSSQAGVFAAGDVRRGASLVVWAIAEGREAARAADLYLMGKTSLPARDESFVTLSEAAQEEA